MFSLKSKSFLSANAVKIVLGAAALVCFAVFFIAGPYEMLSQRSSSDAVFLLVVSLLIMLFCSLFFIFKFNRLNYISPFIKRCRIYLIS